MHSRLPTVSIVAVTVFFDSVPNTAALPHAFKLHRLIRFSKASLPLEFKAVHRLSRVTLGKLPAACLFEMLEWTGRLSVLHGIRAGAACGDLDGRPPRHWGAPSTQR